MQNRHIYCKSCQSLSIVPTPSNIAIGLWFSVDYLAVGWIVIDRAIVISAHMWKNTFLIPFLIYGDNRLRSKYRAQYVFVILWMIIIQLWRKQGDIDNVDKNSKFVYHSRKIKSHNIFMIVINELREWWWKSWMIY